MQQITVSDNFAEVVKKWEKYSNLLEATDLLSGALQQKEKEAKVTGNIVEINKKLKELKELGCTFASCSDEEPIADDLIVLYNGYTDMGTLYLLR